MSWLMVAKIPLLISSRMMSAGFVPSRSASSLTVIVAGSSIAARSVGSTTWTAPGVNAPVRRGGLRGPRRPRVPLLLRAMWPSFVVVDVRGAGDGAMGWFCGGRRDLGDGGDGREAREETLGHRGFERVVRGALAGCEVPACRVATEIGAATGPPAALIEGDRAVRPSDDADEVALRAGRAAGDAAPLGDPPRRGGPAGAGARAYDDTSSEVAALRLRLAGAAATAPSSLPGSASAPAGAVAFAAPLPSASAVPFASVVPLASAAGFFLVARGFAAAGASTCVASPAAAGTSWTFASTGWSTGGTGADASTAGDSAAGAAGASAAGASAA